MIAKDIRNSLGERIDCTFHAGNRRDILVILGHGVTGNKDRPHLVAIAEGISKLGWPALRISFSGNGESDGRFIDSCITKEVDDLTSVLDAVSHQVLPVYMGHSMGGAVGVLTAAKDKRIRGLVSLAGMTHTADFVKREFDDVMPNEGLMWENENCPLSQTYMNDLNSIQNTLSAAASVTQPWLLIHGSADDVVPIQDGEDAFAAATSKKQWLPISGAEHSFDEESFPQVIAAIDAWLTEHFGTLK